MSASQYTQIVLAERPKTSITSSTFRTEVKPFDLKPGQGEVLVQVQWLSLDPAMRGWLNDSRSYIKPVQIGAAMRAGGLGIVIEAGPGSIHAPGDSVSGSFGWVDYAVMADKDIEKILLAPGAELLDYLGPLGMTGLTAYFGLLDVGKPKAGETLLVSGAAGATGSIVCQIGKKVGAKVYAIAGSDEKCAWLEKEVGVEKALNYKSPTFHDDFKEHVGFFDIYFDNVGGDLLNFALTRMNAHARVVLCGAISDYNNAKPQGLTSYMNLIGQRAKIEGFVIFDYVTKFSDARKELSAWVTDGSLKRRFHIVEGLENAPTSLNLLFTGGNTGKLVIKVTHAQPALPRL